MKAETVLLIFVATVTLYAGRADAAPSGSPVTQLKDDENAEIHNTFQLLKQGELKITVGTLSH